MSKQAKIKDLIKQRSDFALSVSIANALVGVVMAGQDLYPEGGLEVAVLDTASDDDRHKTLKISRGTLNSWITRRNVIPETGETLHAVLERAKRAYRINEMDNRRDTMLYKAEKILARLTNLRTNQPVRNMFGQTLRHEDGSLVRKENVSLLKVQADTAKFLLERLKPELYGRKPEKVVVSAFSLAELRRESNKRK